MVRKIRVLYLGVDPGDEYKRLEGVARLAYYCAGGTGVLQLHRAETYGEFCGGGGRVGMMDFIYLASPLEINDVLAHNKKYDERVRGDFGLFYREVNKKIARLLDGGLCVPCRVLDNKLVQGASEHHLVYGEYMPDEFTYLMTVCGLGPTTPGTHHARFHERKVKNSFEMLSAIKKKLDNTRYWRWQEALEYYEKRTVKNNV